MDGGMDEPACRPPGYAMRRKKIDLHPAAVAGTEDESSLSWFSGCGPVEVGLVDGPCVL